MNSQFRINLMERTDGNYSVRSRSVSVLSKGNRSCEAWGAITASRHVLDHLSLGSNSAGHNIKVAEERRICFYDSGYKQEKYYVASG
jgi:hypothetical protein